MSKASVKAASGRRLSALWRPPYRYVNAAACVICMPSLWLSKHLLQPASLQEGIAALGLADSVQLAALQLRPDGATVQPTSSIAIAGQVAAVALSRAAGSQVSSSSSLSFLQAACAWHS